jgi:hypothetical protein
MKSLDEVIRAAHHCGLISGFDDYYKYDGGCPYEDCSKCEKKRMLGKDIIKYLNEYKRISAKLEKIAVGNITETLEKLDNPALTWEELQQMVGKPIWIEAESLCLGINPYWKNWYIIKSFSDDEFMYCNDGYEWAKEMQGRMWQAYRKERNENTR